MSESVEGPYKIVCPGTILAQLRKWGEVASQRDLLDWYVDTLTIIETKLRTQPAQWGDPVYHLHNLKLVVYRGIYSFFAVEFGLHEEEPLVIVRNYRLIPRNPLETT